MEKHFMIDIETTGIDPHVEDLLSVGILEADYVDGFWKPGKSFEMLQYTDRQPESEFAKEHMRALYAKCNEAAHVPPEVFRDCIRSFFSDCGITSHPDTYLMGWNASNFDVPFLVNKKILRAGVYVQGTGGKDVRVGDFHYRIYELGGAVSLAQNVLGYSDRRALIADAESVQTDIQLPKGKEHDALYDCYKQLRLLNGLIHLSRHFRNFPSVDRSLSHE